MSAIAEGGRNEKLFLVVAMCLAATTQLQAKEWKTVGADPNQLSINESVKLLHIPYGISIIHRDEFPDTIWVRRGDIFSEMTFGKGKVVTNVTVAFDSAMALSWNNQFTELVYVLECNNVAWRPYVERFTEEPAQAESAIVVALVTVTPSESDYGGITGRQQTLFWIFAALGLLALLIWLFWVWPHILNTLQAKTTPVAMPASTSAQPAATVAAAVPVKPATGPSAPDDQDLPMDQIAASTKRVSNLARKLETEKAELASLVDQRRVEMKKENFVLGQIEEHHLGKKPTADDKPAAE